MFVVLELELFSSVVMLCYVHVTPEKFKCFNTLHDFIMK